MRIAILGCGPAGLIAAHAAVGFTEVNEDIDIFSRKVKSLMPGAQYLHERIPGVTPYEPDGYLQFIKLGDGAGYAEKVYGNRNAPVSWDKYEEGHFPAWSLAETYDKLWGAWEPCIQDFEFTGRVVHEIAARYDVVLSTIPAPLWCGGKQRCEFPKAKVYFTPNRWRDCEENMIIYNGESNVSWYRTSSIFGHDSTEWATQPTQEHTVGWKPVRTNCQCNPRNVVRLGRFGKWDKQVLVHHAYQETKDALHELL